MAKQLPSVERLHELFRLREDGALVRKIRVWSHHAGEVAGAIHGGKYVRVCVDQQFIMAHRIVWALVHGEWPAQIIDHINGDGLDNRPSNLRLATMPQNLQNRDKPRHNTSGIKGVYATKSGNWLAMIRVHGRLKALGTYTDREDARAAYNNAAAQHFGEFARLA